jgi:uncharacterized phiE125 gp8 family phage protein
MQIVLTTQPAVEPVSAAEAKAHCRVDITTDDTLISSLITAARRQCERYCDIGFVYQTYTITYDLNESPTQSRFIKLPKGNVQSITSIKTYGTDNVASTFSDTNYRVSNNRVVLNDNSNWPALSREFDVLEIIYTVGFGASASNVPQEIKQAILMLVAHWYENREASADPSMNKSGLELIPISVTALLMPYKVFCL